MTIGAAVVFGSVVYFLIGPLQELIMRRYLPLSLLLMLAVTSLPALLRLMGKNWNLLHGSIYLIILLVCVHFWWSVKSGWLEPFIYCGIGVLLLLLRRKKVVMWLSRLRSLAKK